MLIRGKEATGAASIDGTPFGHWETAPLPVLCVLNSITQPISIPVIIQKNRFHLVVKITSFRMYCILYNTSRNLNHMIK